MKALTLIALMAFSTLSPIHAQTSNAVKLCYDGATVLANLALIRDKGVPPQVVYQMLVDRGAPPEMADKMLRVVYFAYAGVEPNGVYEKYLTTCLSGLS